MNASAVGMTGKRWVEHLSKSSSSHSDHNDSVYQRAGSGLESDAIDANAMTTSVLPVERSRMSKVQGAT